MFETLKKMFFFDDPVTNPSEELEIEAEPEISEPVISFVEIFKKNPRRFKISRTYGEGLGDRDSGICGHPQGFFTSGFNHQYSIRDSVTNNCFLMGKTTTLQTKYDFRESGDVVKERKETHNYIPVSKNLEWITTVELEYVYYEISKFLHKRAAERKEKLNNIRRNRYIRQYCENVDLFIEE